MRGDISTFAAWQAKSPDLSGEDTNPFKLCQNIHGAPLIWATVIRKLFGKFRFNFWSFLLQNHSVTIQRKGYQRIKKTEGCGAALVWLGLFLVERWPLFKKKKSHNDSLGNAWHQAQWSLPIAYKWITCQAIDMFFWKSNSEHNWHRRLMLCIATLTFTSAFDLKSSCTTATGVELLSGMGSSSSSSLSIQKHHWGELLWTGEVNMAALFTGLLGQKWSTEGVLELPVELRNSGKHAEGILDRRPLGQVLGCPWTLRKSKVLWWSQAHLTSRW